MKQVRIKQQGVTLKVMVVDGAPVVEMDGKSIIMSVRLNEKQADVLVDGLNRAIEECQSEIIIG